ADVTAGAENLLVDDRRRVRQSRPDGRVNPGAVGELARHVGHAAAGDDGGAFVGRLLVVAQNFLTVFQADQRAEGRRRIFGPAELERLGADLHPRDEFVEDRPLDIDALGAEADLAAIGETRAQRALDRLVEIGVGEDERRVLAAEFERYLTDAERRLAHDRFARARLAGEGDASDERVLGQKLAGRVRPESVHDVVDALRHASLVHHLAEQSCGQRRLLRRLDDDRVAAGERRADLPRHQKQRQVPRRDDRDDALRPAEPVIDRALAVLRRHDEGLGRDPFDGVGEHFEIGGAARDVEVAGETRGLAGVEALGGEELLEPRDDAVGDPREDVGALGDRHLAPGAGERSWGGAAGRVDLRLATLGHAADDAVVERRAVFPALAGRALGENAVDEVGGVAAGALEACRRLFKSLNRHVFPLRDRGVASGARGAYIVTSGP